MMSIIRKITKSTLRVLPDEGRMIKNSVRQLLVRKELALTKFGRDSALADLPDPRTIYWIDPYRIEFHTSMKTDSPDWEDWVFSQRRGVTLVQDGDWDLSDLKISDMRVVQAVEERVKHGVAWSSTDYYQTAVRQINAGRHLWGCADQAGFDRHCVDLDALIDSISNRGYLQAKELGASANIDSALGHQEVIVNLSRAGCPIFQDGRHRLAIARALKLPSVPVQVLVRHAEWQAFRRFMQRMAKGGGGAARKGVLYQNPTHFDLSSISSEHGCEDRWRAMADNISPTGGRALDIGCNLGYFCHGLERLGYSAIGIEYLPDIAYAAQKIARAESMKFEVIEGDILSDEMKSQIGVEEFSLVLAVNIFHHFIKTESGFKRLERFMTNINCRAMFFEPHLPDEVQMQNSFTNPSPLEFANIIGKWGRFNSIVPIYTADDGRTIFSLTR